MIVDCVTCEFAQRDKHNRYLDRCSGYGNCGYEEFKGIIKPTLEECIQNLTNNLSNTNSNYTQGFNDALAFISAWNEYE